MPRASGTGTLRLGEVYCICSNCNKLTAISNWMHPINYNYNCLYSVAAINIGMLPLGRDQREQDRYGFEPGQGFSPESYPIPETERGIFGYRLTRIVPTRSNNSEMGRY